MSAMKSAQDLKIGKVFAAGTDVNCHTSCLVITLFIDCYSLDCPRLLSFSAHSFRSSPKL